MKIQDYLKDNLLLFDGAMGTYYANLGHTGSCELANLTNPYAIAKIHTAYLNAGCQAIKTNTFGANRPLLGEQYKEVIRSGYRLATEAGSKAETDAYVFADIGPLPSEDCNHTEEYGLVADEFLELGAKHFLFETLSALDGILETAIRIKETNQDAFILVSVAGQPDGFTRAGLMVKDLLTECMESGVIDAVGVNCVTSVGHMNALLNTIGPLHFPLSVMPNAGYPVVLGRQVIYKGMPQYFGSQLAKLRRNGISIFGGCCGTTPEHMKAAKDALAAPLEEQKAKPSRKREKAASEGTKFWKALCDSSRKPIAVELDSPEAADVSKFISGAKELKDIGVDVITIADCPIGRSRMDSSILACKLHRELDMETLPHLTCRDRNINATKALLLGLCAEGVHNVLAITGDPIASSLRDEVKSVYNFNSRKLARYIASLNETSLPVPFHIFAALNVNAHNFDVQLHLAEQKLENGAVGFLTQPVLTKQALENLKQARETLDAKIIGGIFPLVSYRNAVFMDSEVSGVSIDPEIIAQYRDLSREEGEDLAVRISTEFAKEMYDYIDGYYFMTPFGRTGLISRIIGELRSMNLV